MASGYQIWQLCSESKEPEIAAQREEFMQKEVEVKWEKTMKAWSVRNTAILICFQLNLGGFVYSQNHLHWDKGGCKNRAM